MFSFRKLRIWEAMKILPVFFFLFSQTSFASFSPEFLANIHFLIAQKHRKDFSPVHGFNAVESGLLKKIRLYSGFGPEKEKEFYCHFQVNDHQKDCPQNPLAAWIQRLFPSPNLPEVVPNTAASDPISKLPPEIMGLMMEWALHNQSELTADNIKQKTQELWKFIRLSMFMRAKATKEKIENPWGFIGDRISSQDRIKEKAREALKKLNLSDREFEDAFHKLDVALAKKKNDFLTADEQKNKTIEEIEKKISRKEDQIKTTQEELLKEGLSQDDRNNLEKQKAIFENERKSFLNTKDKILQSGLKQSNKSQKTKEKDKIEDLLTPWVEKYHDIQKGKAVIEGEFNLTLSPERIELTKRIKSIEDYKKLQPHEKEDFQIGLFHIFLQTFVQSLVYEQTPGAIKGITIDTLWAFFYKKTSDWRKDLSRLLTFASSLKGDPIDLDQPIDIDPEHPKTEWENDWRIPFYAKEAYEANLGTIKLPTPLIAKRMWNPEKIFEKKEDLEKELITRMQNGFSDNNTYTSCGEEALQNFWNIVLYDPNLKKINLLFLKQISKKIGEDHKLYGQGTTARGLKAFYNYTHDAIHYNRSFSYTSLQDQKDSDRSFHLWSAMVTTHLNDGVEDPTKHVVYFAKQGEIGSETPQDSKISSGKGGLANMMRVIERLFNIEDLAQFSPQKDNAAIKEWAQKLNGLCHLLSRKDFNLSWEIGEFSDHSPQLFDVSFKPQQDLPDNPQTKLKVVFSINTRKGFFLTFSQGHFSTQLLQSSNEEEPKWRFEKMPKLDENGSFLKEIDFAWYVDSKTQKDLLKGDNLQQLAPIVIYQLFEGMHDFKRTLEAIDIIAKKELRSFYESAAQWANSLNLNNKEIRRPFLKMLTENPELEFKVLQNLIRQPTLDWDFKKYFFLGGSDPKYTENDRINQVENITLKGLIAHPYSWKDEENKQQTMEIINSTFKDKVPPLEMLSAVITDPTAWKNLSSAFLKDGFDDHPAHFSILLHAMIPHAYCWENQEFAQMMFKKAQGSYNACSLLEAMAQYEFYFQDNFISILKKLGREAEVEYFDFNVLAKPFIWKPENKEFIKILFEKLKLLDQEERIKSQDKRNSEELLKWISLDKERWNLDHDFVKQLLQDLNKEEAQSVLKNFLIAGQPWVWIPEGKQLLEALYEKAKGKNSLIFDDLKETIEDHPNFLADKGSVWDPKFADLLEKVALEAPTPFLKNITPPQNWPLENQEVFNRIKKIDPSSQRMK